MPKRTVVRATWVLLAVAVAAVGWWRPLHHDLSFALDLSIGIFGGLVAAITFALALTIQQEQAWPSAPAVVRDSGAVAWTVISVGSLAFGIASDVLPSHLVANAGTASLWLSLWALLVGIWNVGSILSAAGGPGRRQARTRILRVDLRAASVAHGGLVGRAVRRDRTLDDFLISFRRAVEAEDMAGIRGHTEEIIAASHGLGHAEQTDVVSTHLRMASILGSELVRGDPPLAASAAFQDLLAGAVDAAGRTLDSQRVSGPHDPLAERRAVVTLGETTRLAAFFSKAILQRYHEGQRDGSGVVEDEHATRIMTTCDDVRERIRHAVDPDPPEKLLKAEDPWREGVTEPESILLWLWANTDFDGTNQRSSLYSVYEVFMGDKYFGTVFGDTSVVSDLRRSSMGSATPEAVRTLESFGGFDRVFLEVCTNSLAQIKPFAWDAPPQLREHLSFTSNPRSRIRQFVSLQATDAERPRNVDAAIDDLVFLLGPSGGKFSTHALGEYRRHGVGMLFPGREVSSRPPAAALAAALSLMSSTATDADAQKARLRSFFARLPPRLLDETHAFAATVLQPPHVAGPSDQAADLINQLSIVWER